MIKNFKYTTCLVLILFGSSSVCVNASAMADSPPSSRSSTDASAQTDGRHSPRMVSILPPTCDPIFKLVFDNDVRLMSFLNAFFYPESDGDHNALQIRDIRRLPGEVTPLRTDGRGTFRFDVICKCTCYAMRDEQRLPETEIVFDVEMQKSVTDKFVERERHYGYALRRTTDRPVTILGICNKDTRAARFAMAPFKMDFHTGKPADEPERDGVQIYNIPLTWISNELQRLEDSPEEAAVTLYGKRLGSKALDWFRFLSVEHWAPRTPEETGTYQIDPQKFDEEPEICGAIDEIEHMDPTEKLLIAKAEARDRDALADERRQGEEEGRRRGEAEGVLRSIKLLVEMENKEAALALLRENQQLLRQVYGKELRRKLRASLDRKDAKVITKKAKTGHKVRRVKRRARPSAGDSAAQ